MHPPIAVLIVDTDAEVASSLRAGLTVEGCECETAENAEDALTRMKAAPADVIVADLRLPDDVLGLAAEAKKIKPDVALVILVDDVGQLPCDEATERGFSDFVVRPFSLRELALRVRHIAHHETLRVVSVTDELTGLHNRRGFFTLAGQLLKMARRQGRGIYMMYADVDHLKRINDTFGHGAGDQALIETARLLRQTYRESDIVARIGGDEFVVIPIGSTGDNIEAITSRLTTNLEARRARGDMRYLPTLSVGIVYYDPLRPCTLDELLTEGDRRMYEKKKGRGGA